MTNTMERWLEALRRDPRHWIRAPKRTGDALVKLGLAERKLDFDHDYERTVYAYRAVDPPCDICGQPCGNPEGRHYECQCLVHTPGVPGYDMDGF